MAAGVWSARRCGYGTEMIPTAGSDMSVAREIAEAHRALEPLQAAHVIFKSLFENGPTRMSDSNKFAAISAITGGLIEWKKQLLAAQATQADVWKKRYEDTKAELDDVRLKLAILQKEQ